MAEERFPYEIVSRWSVPGAIEDVYDVLTDGESRALWWPEAYASVRKVEPGDTEGRGRVDAIVTRGFLPYDVNWRLKVLDAAPPTMIRVEASGDLCGLGEWRLTQRGAAVELVYTWRVRVEKPWMRRLEFILKPLFTMNHNWIMRHGEAGLKRELARRASAG
jgi:uncharacterized protein YndB with AHSA1/START domain